MRGSVYDLVVRAGLAARGLAFDVDDETGTLPSQKRLISRIEMDGTSTINELALDMGVTPGVVSRMVKRLEQCGYVEWRHRPRRGTPVKLTYWGKQARKLAGAHDIDYELTSEMSPRDVAELKRLLGLVIRARFRYRKPTR